MKNNFIKFLKEKGFSDNTISAYLISVKKYDEMYYLYNRKNIMAYKSYLISRYKPKTVNLRLQGINTYLSYIGKGNLKISQLMTIDPIITKA